MQALSYRLLDRPNEAIAADLERLARNPKNPFSNCRLAAVFGEQERHEEAREQITELLRKNPNASIRQVRACDHIKTKKSWNASSTHFAPSACPSRSRFASVDYSVGEGTAP